MKQRQYGKRKAKASTCVDLEKVFADTPQPVSKRKPLGEITNTESSPKHNGLPSFAHGGSTSEEWNISPIQPVSRRRQAAKKEEAPRKLDVGKTGKEPKQEKKPLRQRKK